MEDGWISCALQLLVMICLCLGLPLSYLLLLCVSDSRHVFHELWVASVFLVGLNMTRITMLSRNSVPGWNYKFRVEFQAGKANRTQQHNKKRVGGGKTDGKDSCKMQNLESREGRTGKKRVFWKLVQDWRRLEPNTTIESGHTLIDETLTGNT